MCPLCTAAGRRCSEAPKRSPGQQTRAFGKLSRQTRVQVRHHVAQPGIRRVVLHQVRLVRRHDHKSAVREQVLRAHLVGRRDEPPRRQRHGQHRLPPPVERDVAELRQPPRHDAAARHGKQTAERSGLEAAVLPHPRRRRGHVSALRQRLHVHRVVVEQVGLADEPEELVNVQPRNVLQLVPRRGLPASAVEGQLQQVAGDVPLGHERHQRQRHERDLLRVRVDVQHVDAVQHHVQVAVQVHVAVEHDAGHRDALRDQVGEALVEGEGRPARLAHAAEHALERDGARVDGHRQLPALLVRQVRHGLAVEAERQLVVPRARDHLHDDRVQQLRQHLRREALVVGARPLRAVQQVHARLEQRLDRQQHVHVVQVRNVGEHHPQAVEVDAPEGEAHAVEEGELQVAVEAAKVLGRARQALQQVPVGLPVQAVDAQHQLALAAALRVLEGDHVPQRQLQRLAQRQRAEQLEGVAVAAQRGHHAADAAVLAVAVQVRVLREEPLYLLQLQDRHQRRRLVAPARVVVQHALGRRVDHRRRGRPAGPAVPAGLGPRGHGHRHHRLAANRR
ncbi:uncharacterized protein BcabD6B2_30600 [Babesia caballi]|uniref:Uncharacterized protein n=1 Tax=Babesia caballi TaxID=5871 RepID=A0AAV4LUV8_BABCB|nr:hypothetical protein BcabD6B2_30600 [Babesia caballi]